MLTRRPAAVLLILALLAPACAGSPPPASTPAPVAAAPAAPAPAPKPAPPLDGWVHAYAGALGHGDATRQFHGEVLVAQGDEVIVHRGYHGDPGRRYRIGSITKPFTAIAVLQLAAAGKLGLDDAVVKHVPELPAAYRGVTIAQLLSHRGGLANYTSDEALHAKRGEPHTHAQMLAAIAGQPMKDEPGKRWSYSNSGYYLLGLVVERVSGQPWADYLAKHVFAPAGMKETDVAVTPLARGLTVKGDAVVDAHPVHPSVPFSAGSITSTARDLHRFARALQDDTLLPAAWRARMWEDRGGPTPTMGWGYGWMLRDRDGTRTVGHDGGIDGFSSSLEMTTDGRWVMVALSNLDTVGADTVGVPALRMALTDAAIEPPKPVTFLPFDPELGKTLAGSYALPPAVEAKVREQLGGQLADAVRTATFTADGTYTFKPVGQGTIELKLRDDGHLVHEAANIEIYLEKAATPDAPAHLVLKQGGLTLVYERAKATPARPKR